ncbi:GDSL-type esterase/lipase family protein [Streptacidiphilus sp. P02-A3a]|uniref:GDSL-type esterase/lipase family protein n=1 Tax=Streptacidiphilus sp. P02-A3a TaxID=2704468 RepID=UPI0015F8BE83|nr:GDSL-type esterase/lipase family protein [Streptacidiphilus sp. P02-A3a]QMU71616.1 lipolytic protein G-D-S-L [Streptacidiphilus sp. P02-A3a]
MNGRPAVAPGAGPVRWLAPQDPGLSWDGTLELERVADGWLPRRFPGRRVATTSSEGFANLAAMAAGVRFAVRTDAEELLLRLNAAPGGAPLDVRVDGAPAHRATLAGECELVVPLAPPGTRPVRPAPRHVEVWLPHLGHTRVRGVGFRGHRTLAPADRTGPRWVTYGSSITHSMFASGPSETWTALVAAGNGWRLHNLGFAGEAHLDPVVARTIRALPADLVSLELGINVYLRESFSARSWIPAVCGFIETIREGHPDLPLAVITPLSSPTREHAPNRVGLTLAQVREHTAAAVRILDRLGDKHLHILDGLSLVPTDEAADLLADGLHPTPEGEHVLAERIAPALRSLLPPP